MNVEPSRHVGARLVLDVQQPLEAILQVAVSGMTGAAAAEDLTVSRDGEPVTVTEEAMPGGAAELIESQVTAVTDGMLPADDVTALTSIR